MTRNKVSAECCKTLAKFDELDKQIQRCTKLWVIFDVLLIVFLIMVFALNVYSVFSR